LELVIRPGAAFRRSAICGIVAYPLIGEAFMRTSFAFGIALTGLAAVALGDGSASARAVQAGPGVSWGKAGISLEQYWTDSALCGHQAAGVDLSGSEPAKALIVASRRMDNWSDFVSIQQAMRMAAPQIQWERAARIMQRELERCLSERGYTKFKLTKGQSRRLAKLKAGSLERRKYLYSLASDPAVLQAQLEKDT
jgi:hypothetical protein